MVEPVRWRLIHDVARDGAWNMAIDDAVLEAVAGGASLPTLRLYDWQPPCISIGYAQKATAFDLGRVREAGLGFVRRPSGGRGVLHKRELTYCVCVPGDDWRVAGGVTESYRRLSDGFLAGLRQLGVVGDLAPGEAGDKAASAACFDAPSRYELTTAGHKLVGSAQWRHNGGVLQHGSVPLDGDVAEVVEYLRLSDADRERARSMLWRRAGTVSQAIGRPVGYAEVASAMTTGLAESLRVDWVDGALDRAELERAEALAEGKYATEAWNHRA